MTIEITMPYQMRVLEEAVAAHVRETRATYTGMTHLLPNHHPAVMEIRETLLDTLKTFRALVRTKDQFHQTGRTCGTPGCNVGPEDSRKMITEIIFKIRVEIANLEDLQQQAREHEPMDADDAVGMVIGVVAAHTGANPLDLI